jgi:hypothetical protein
LKTEAVLPKLSKEQIAAKIAALQAKLEEDDDGVYEDPRTGRWFIVMRPPGRTTTTTRRRSPNGGQLLTRDQALIARGPWEAQMASGTVAPRPANDLDAQLPGRGRVEPLVDVRREDGCLERRLVLRINAEQLRHVPSFEPGARSRPRHDDEHVRVILSCLALHGDDPERLRGRGQARSAIWEPENTDP